MDEELLEEGWLAKVSQASLVPDLPYLTGGKRLW